MTMQWVDVSLPLHQGLVCWPGDPAFDLEPLCTVEQDGVRVSRLQMGSHSGTHVDAPAHFVAGGRGVDGIEPWRLVGPCRVLDLQGVTSAVGRADLERFAPRAGERLLLKTGSEAHLHSSSFDPSYVGLDAEGARFLVEAGVVLVGIDALSIEPFEAGTFPTHHALLQHGVVIVEGLDLGGVEAGEWELIVLPLRLCDADGAPARALLGRPRP